MLSLESDYPPAHQLALDMLKVCNSQKSFIQIILQLYFISQKHVRPRNATLTTTELYIFYFRKNWVLTESRIPLKQVLGGVRIVAHSISSHEQTQ